jgi:hypothetical protein
MPLSLTGNAPHFGAVAVDFSEFFLAGLDMQIVNILSNGHLQDSHFFEVGQCEVTRVWLGSFDCFSEVGAVRIMLLGLLFIPPCRRVSKEIFVPIHRGFTEFGPQAAWASECRNSALHRQSGPDQSDDISRPRNSLGGLFQIQVVICGVHGISTPWVISRLSKSP